jgi:hypothetical protein
VRIAKRYLPDDQHASGFAALIESLDEASWNRLSNRVPSAIAEREPLEFDAFDGVSAEQLHQVAHSGE